MNNINPIRTPQMVQFPLFARAPRVSSMSACAPGQDRVELSQAAVKACKAHGAAKAPMVWNVGNVHDGGGVRLDLVRRVRAEIAAGVYETPEKIEAIIDTLANRLSESQLRLSDRDV